MLQTIRISAPFEMPALTYPDCSHWPRFPIDRGGASEGDMRTTTRAITDLIDRANAAGGGIVVVPAGYWRTGKIHFKSNVCLEVSDGATLVFSGDPSDYLPPVPTSWEGMSCCNYSPLIYAYRCENIAITGGGTLRAEMQTWADWFERPPAHMQALAKLYNMAVAGVRDDARQMVGDGANLRPQFIHFNQCRHVLVEGVHIEESPFWVIHPYRCEHVYIRDVCVKAHGHNSDGVDLEMTQIALVERCTFDQGDDAIVIKSGRNHDGWRLNTPSKHIVVRDCTVRHGHHLLVIGSELSGGVESVFLQRCQIDPAIGRVGSLVYVKTNHRRGGYVRDIHVQGVRAGTLKDSVLAIETEVLYQWKQIVKTHETRLTPISNFSIRDVAVDDVNHVTRIDSCAQQPVRGVLLDNVVARRVRGQRHVHEHVVGFETRAR